MTLTKEEIEMIEREAEMLASQNSNGQRDWWMVYDTCKAVATKYLLQLKEERERAGKLMVAFEWVKRKISDSNLIIYMKEKINEYTITNHEKD